MGVEIFTQTPCGLELVHSNLLFNFVVGTIKHQATGRQNAVVRGNGFVHAGYSLPPSSRKRTKQEGYLRLFAMANKMDCY